MSSWHISSAAKDAEGRRIRIAIVINDFLIGGAQRLIVEMLKAADRERFEFVLVTLFDFGGRETLFQALPAGIAVHRLHFRGFMDLRSWLKLRRVLGALDPDIVFSHLFFANTVTRILGLFERHRVITTEHNTYFNKTAPQRLADRILAYRTWRIVAVSETVVDYTTSSEGIPREKFVVIHDGIDVEGVAARARATSRVALRKDLDISDDAKVFISVARLVPQKNHALLLRAFAEHVKTFQNDILLLVGGGILEGELKSLAKELHIEACVRFLGAQQDPVPFYAVADVFVSTSRMEGFGIAHVEAMACGLPIVTTKTAGPDRFIQDGVNGFFISEDPKAIAEILAKTASAPQVMKDAARAAASKFDISRAVRAYQELFMSAVSS